MILRARKKNTFHIRFSFRIKNSLALILCRFSWEICIFILPLLMIFFGILAIILTKKIFLVLIFLLNFKTKNPPNGDFLNFFIKIFANKILAVKFVFNNGGVFYFERKNFKRQIAKFGNNRRYQHSMRDNNNIFSKIL